MCTSLGCCAEMIKKSFANNVVVEGGYFVVVVRFNFQFACVPMFISTYIIQLTPHKIKSDELLIYHNKLYYSMKYGHINSLYNNGVNIWSRKLKRFALSPKTNEECLIIKR